MDKKIVIGLIALGVCCFFLLVISIIYYFYFYNKEEEKEDSTSSGSSTSPISRFSTSPSPSPIPISVTYSEIIDTDISPGSNDIGGQNGTLDECKTSCTNDPNCKAFVRETVTGNCFKKSVVSPVTNALDNSNHPNAYIKKTDSSVIYSEIIDTDISPGSNDIGGQNGTLDECKTSCTNDPNCKAFVRETVTGNCFKKSVVSPVTNALDNSNHPNAYVKM